LAELLAGAAALVVWFVDELVRGRRHRELLEAIGRLARQEHDRPGDHDHRDAERGEAEHQHDDEVADPAGHAGER